MTANFDPPTRSVAFEDEQRSSRDTSPVVDFPFLRQLVYEQTQNVLDPSRDYLFEARLSAILRNLGLSTIEDLIQLLQQRRNAELERQIAETMTINETSFFRDSRPFELLRTELLPQLIEARRTSRSLRFWSAACSTGQEAYSIGMLLLEHFPQITNHGGTQQPRWKIRIEGTDIASAVVEQARKGTYQRIEMNRGLPARNIVRYFDHNGEDHQGEYWSVKPQLRKLVNFRVANLCAGQPPYSEVFDVVLLRNVMLYLSQESRKKLLANVHRFMASDGILILGSSEQPADSSIWISHLARGTCYFRPRPPA